MTVIDNQVVWFGMPPSRDNFKTKKDNGFFEIIPTSSRPVIRIYGKNSSNAIFNFLEMAKAKIVAQSIPVSNKMLDGNRKNLTAQTKKVFPAAPDDKTNSVSEIAEKETNDTATRQFPDRKYFSDYISENFTCKKCNKPLKLQKGKKTFYLRCTSCNSTQNIEEAHLKFFLMFGNPEEDKCPICNSPMVIRKGSQGFYLECMKHDHPHRFTLDMI